MKKLFFIAALLAPWSAQAVTFGDESAAVAYALSHNRELRAARMAIAEATARARGAGRLSNPEIEAVVAGGQDFEGRIELGLYQRFPLSARLRLEKEISQLEIEAATFEVNERQRAIARQVRRAFLTLAQAGEARALRARQAELGLSFADSLGRRVTEGFASPLDASEAMLEARQLKVSVLEYQAEEIAAAGELTVLLGLPNGEKLALKDALLLPKTIAATRAPSARPDIRLAEIAIEAAEKDLGLARAMRWEDIGIGVFVEGERFRDEPEGIENEGLLGMKLTVPLPVWNNGVAAVEERKLIAQRRRELLDILRFTAAQQADATWRQMNARLAAARQMQDDVLPLARKLLADTQTAYDRGEADVQRLFRARGHLIEVETAALESLTQFHLARAEWLAAVGEPSKP